MVFRKGLKCDLGSSIIIFMEELRALLFEKGRVAKVLEALRHPSLPDSQGDPRRALLYGHALCLYGDFNQALEVFSEISPDPAWDAELLWGQANALINRGELERAKLLLNQAFQQGPSGWLRPYLHYTRFKLLTYSGEFDQAAQAIEDGIRAAQENNYPIPQLVLEGHRGSLKLFQGAFEEAIFLFQKAVKQLQARDSVLYAAHFLIRLSDAFEALDIPMEAGKCLRRAEGLIRESGSRDELIFLKYLQGNVLKRQGRLDPAERVYQEGLDLLRDSPIPTLEVETSCALARLQFEKGKLGASLALVRKALGRVRESGLSVLENLCLGNEGYFLLHSGATRDGIALLHRAADSASALNEDELFTNVALFLSRGYEDLGERSQALGWLQRSLEKAEENNFLSILVAEREMLISLLLSLGEELPPSEFLSKLIVHLRHPGLLKSLLRQSPRGKVLFLRTLEAHDARNYLPQLARLKEDSEKEVRRTSRLLLQGWQKHSGYRAYAFGSLRVFQEGKMLTDRDWIRPGVKRLFLYLATYPDKWHATDALLEALWTKPHPQRTRKVLVILFTYLRKVLEPWSRLTGEKGESVFFRSQRGAYGFFPGERFWMDSREFADGLKQAESAQRNRDFKAARKAYREALDLYSGDYLEEYPYEDWLEPRREYLRETYFRGVQRYATLERDSGNLPEARRVLEEALFRDLSQGRCLALLFEMFSRMKLVQEARDWGQRYRKHMKGRREKPPPEVLEALNGIT